MEWRSEVNGREGLEDWYQEEGIGEREGEGSRGEVSEVKVGVWRRREGGRPFRLFQVTVTTSWGEIMV